MAIHAYNETYLNYAQKLLGHAVDYAVTTLEIDPDAFCSAFAVSSISKRFAKGNPTYVAGMNGCELARMILDEVCYPYTATEDVMYIDRSPEYWAGWALAFYQWYYSRTFMEIITVVPLSKIIQMYPIYHETDLERFRERMDTLLNEAYPHTKLKMRRLNSRMSQAELARDSGVALRQIQLFEQRQRDINNASAVTLLKLSRSLNCSMEDLIELSTAS